MHGVHYRQTKIDMYVQTSAAFLFVLKCAHQGPVVLVRNAACIRCGGQTMHRANHAALLRKNLKTQVGVALSRARFDAQESKLANQ